MNAGSVDSVLHNKGRVSIKRRGRGTLSTRQIIVTCNGNEQESVHRDRQYQAS